MRYSPEHSPNDDGMALENRFDLPAEGDYEFAGLPSAAAKNRFVFTCLLDGKEIQTSDVLIEKDKPRSTRFIFTSSMASIC